MKRPVLTDAHQAAIVWAAPDERTVDLARRIGAPYKLVHAFWGRITRAGGWFCPLARVPCTECGELLLVRADTKPRHVHPGCEQDRRNRHARRSRTEAHPGSVSTPHVRAWCARDSEQDTARYADPESQAASLSTLTAARVRDHALTVAQADRARQRWTPDEDERVLDLGKVRTGNWPSSSTAHSKPSTCVATSFVSAPP